MRVGTEEGLFFDRGFLGDRARLLQCLHHAYLEVIGDPLKNGGLWTLYGSKYAI